MDIAVVVRIEILRTYDIVNYVTGELEYDPCMLIRVRSFPEYFESVSRNEMRQNVRCDMDIDRVVFDEIHFLFKTFSRRKRNNQGTVSEFSESPEFNHLEG